LGLGGFALRSVYVLNSKDARLQLGLCKDRAKKFKEFEAEKAFISNYVAHRWCFGRSAMAILFSPASKLLHGFSHGLRLSRFILELVNITNCDIGNFELEKLPTKLPSEC
jgi:hypothetical protein